MGRNLLKFEKISDDYFFVFGCIKLKFSARTNFGLLTSNLNLKMEHQYKILTKTPVFFSLIMIFSPSVPHELLTMAKMNDLLSIF